LFEISFTLFYPVFRPIEVVKGPPGFSPILFTSLSFPQGHPVLMYIDMLRFVAIDVDMLDVTYIICTHMHTNNTNKCSSPINHPPEREGHTVRWKRGAYNYALFVLVGFTVYFFFILCFFPWFCVLLLLLL